MKTALFLVAALLLLPTFAFAFDCSSVDDNTYCENILNSNLNESEKDQVLSFLLYQQTKYPNHSFVEEYNRDIAVDSPPDGTLIRDSLYIKNVWLSFLTISPSVYENNILYVPRGVKVLSEYDFEIITPPDYRAGRYPQNSQGDCRRTYSVQSTSSNLNYYHNSSYVGNGKEESFVISSSGQIRAELIISTQIKIKHYQWKRYGVFGRNYYRCEAHHTSYQTDQISLVESKKVELFITQPQADLLVTNLYQNTTKGNFTAQDYSMFILSFRDSQFEEQKKYYDLVFEKKPFHIAFLRASNTSERRVNNIHVEGDTFYVQNTEDCSLRTYNHFYQFQSNCDLTVNQEEIDQLDIEKNEPDLRLLLYLLVFLFIFYIFYRVIKSQMKKIILPLLLVIILLPSVMASSHTPTPSSECSLSNLGACLTENFFEYLLAIILTGPLVPLLIFIERLLTASVSIELFFAIWNIIRYILSFFYLFFFLYAGYVFLTGNNDPIKRAHAKEMLQNTVLMMVLINGSYYLYQVILDLSSVLNSSIIRMVEPTFFLLTADNIVNIGLQFMLSGVYGLTLLLTVIMLTLRYIVVSLGVVLLPIGIFLYFIPPLKGYGKFILNMLGIFIFITFIDLLIILACSLIINVPLFANFKIIVMITCFTLINYTLWLAIKFALKKSANTNLKDDFKQAAKYIAMLV